MREVIRTMLTAVVAISVFAFAGLATADKPVCLDADGDEVACEKKGPPGDAESADGTGTESADGTGTESADGTGIESADGTGIESADGTGVESADGTGTESEADPEGG